MLGGTQDTTTLLSSAATPGQWTIALGGDGGMSAFDPLDANTMYYEYHGLGLSKTTDGGNTYVPAVTGITEPGGDFPFVTYFTSDPQNSLTLYMGGNQLWRSGDGALTWAAASPNTGAAISAIAVNPTSSDQVIYGDINGVIYNGSVSNATWNTSQPRSGYVSRIVFDPTQPGVIYATYATFRGQPSDSQLYLSTDGGNTWTAMAGSSLPDIPVHALLIDPDLSSTLYIGTDLGVFVSFDSGTTWAADSSFPAVVTESLQMDKNGATKYLYAFTYGRGAWRVNLLSETADCTYSVSPQSLPVDGTGSSLYSVNVNTSLGCGWSASGVQSLPYIRMQSPAGGNGPGTLYFLVAANYTGAQRALQFSLQDQTVTIQQAALAESPLTFDGYPGTVIATLPYYRASEFNELSASSQDPVHSCTGTRGMSTGYFTYVASASQRIDATAAASGGPASLSAYLVTGALSGNEIACASNSSNPSANVSVQFDAVAGSRYLIEISGYGQTLGSAGHVNLTVQVLPIIAVSSAATTLAPGQTTQLTATVTGTPNTAVRWTAQYGAIDANGNYTAPANTVLDTVTATSLADPNATATAAIAVQMQ
jgi:hypothetical protein